MKKSSTPSRQRWPNEKRTPTALSTKYWPGPDWERIIEARGPGISRVGGWIRVARWRSDVRRDTQSNVGKENSRGRTQSRSAGDELPVGARGRKKNSGGDRHRRENVREVARHLWCGRALLERPAGGLRRPPPGKLTQY